MKNWTQFFLISHFFLFSFSAKGEVYLNRDIIDNKGCVWEYKMLDWDGKSLSLSWDYQNEYGACYGLPPGPPFIIEAWIRLDNLKDPVTGEVTSTGDFYMNSSNPPEEREEDPFTIVFINPPDVPASEGNSHLDIDGNIQVIGTDKHPIVFSGALFLSKGWDRNEEIEVRFQHCTFKDFSGDVQLLPINIHGGHTLFEHCSFEDFPDVCRHVINFEPQDKVFDFTLRNCQFKNNRIDYHMTNQANALVSIQDPRSVIIENNRFTGNSLKSKPSPVLINISSAHNLTSIQGNQGWDNTVNAIRVSQIHHDQLVEYPESTLACSDSLPILLASLTVPDYQTCRIDSGSVIKIGPGVYYPGRTISIHGTFYSNGVTFTSYQDDSTGGDTYLEPEPEVLSYWGSNNGGFRIEPSGEAHFSQCRFYYGCTPIYANGILFLKDSYFWNNTRNCIYFRPTDSRNYKVSNTVFTQTRKTGGGLGDALSFNTGELENKSCSLLLDRVQLIQNEGDGFDQGYISHGDFHLVFDRCVAASNGGHGFNLACRNSNSISVRNSVFATNGECGIKYGEGDWGDTTRFLIANNLFLGNGIAGAWKISGRLQIYHNTFAWNEGVGLGYRIPKDTGSAVLNNLFLFNKKHLSIETWFEEKLFHNNFWTYFGDNPIFIDAQSYLESMEDLWAMGSRYTTNTYLNPQLVPQRKIQVAGSQAIERYNCTLIQLGSDQLLPEEMSGLILSFSPSYDKWYYIQDNTSNSITILGIIPESLNGEDSILIFDPHLSYNSPLIDAGSPLPEELDFPDMDNQDRIYDGDMDQVALPDIGADEVPGYLYLHSDQDGIPDPYEMGPQGDDPEYDSNGDGTPDYLQCHIVSFPSFDRQHYLSLWAREGICFSKVKALDNPGILSSPDGEEFPLGFVGFQLNGFSENEAVEVTLTLPPGFLADAYYRYGPEPDNPVIHWYRFDQNGLSGAKAIGNSFILTFVDGSYGDDDLTLNGIIQDAGGPTFKATGISESPHGTLPFTLWPNPSRGTVWLEFETEHSEKVEIILQNLAGQQIEVLQNQVYPGKGNLLELNFSSNPPGIYFLTLRTDHDWATRKLIILNH